MDICFGGLSFKPSFKPWEYTRDVVVSVRVAARARAIYNLPVSVKLKQEGEGLITNHRVWETHTYLLFPLSLSFTPPLSILFTFDLWCGPWRDEGSRLTKLYPTETNIYKLSTFTEHVFFGG